jgi:8-amino-7-oxononanoate synthase
LARPFNTGSCRKRKKLRSLFCGARTRRFAAWLSTNRARDARTIRIGKETYVNFAGNDYLALRFHPALINRAEAWAEEHGVGSGASRLVTGHLDLFAGIEAKVAVLKQKPAALIMASGFQANA